MIVLTKRKTIRWDHRRRGERRRGEKNRDGGGDLARRNIMNSDNAARRGAKAAGTETKWRKLDVRNLPNRCTVRAKLAVIFKYQQWQKRRGKKRLLNSHHLGDYSLAANVINVSPFHSNVNLIVVGLIVSLYREASLLQYCQLTATPQSQLCCQT